jgi:DNA-binding transcriptional MerR regulator
MPTDTDYSIADLARLTGVSVRTIRYYLAQGLLPASGEAGPGAHYGQGHLDRLRLTKRLQAQHLPLAEIRRQLEALSDQQVAELVSSTVEPPKSATGSALDYVRSVLGSAGPQPMPLRLPPAPAQRMLFAQAAPAASAPVASAGSASAASAPSEPAVEAQPSAPERSQWERLSLAPDIELHVRRPLSRADQKRVERLITIARQVLREDQP